MNQTFSLVILVEFPEEISFYVVPSDHPHLPALRKAAKNHAVVNTTVCSEEDTKTILDVFYPHQGDGYRRHRGWSLCLPQSRRLC